MAGEFVPILPEEPEICIMDLDRPFLFVIRSRTYGGTVDLFVGTVQNL